MLRFIIAVAVGLTLSACNSDTKAQDANYARVLSVYDGDTFTIESQSLGGIMAELPNLRVRIRDLDTPEKGAQAKCKAERDHALIVTREAKRLIAGSDNVVIIENLDWDKYGGRINADVYLSDGRSLAEVLIKFGHARYYDGKKRGSWC